MKRHAMLGVLVLLLFAGWERADADDDKPLKATFDTLQTQHIVVKVKINGKGPYRLIFDTGAPFTVLNTKVAKETGILTKDAEPAALALLGALPQYQVKSLELGDVKADNLSVMVMDHPTVSAIDKLLGPVEGIVGLTLFGKYRTTIDYQAKEMTFVPVKFNPPDVTKGMLAILSNPGSQKTVLAPAGQWGFSVTKDAKDEEAGVNVKAVLVGSPAATAGLKAGDRLLTLEGRWTDTVADCYRAASAVRPGATARLVVRRDGKEVELKVTVTQGL